MNGDLISRKALKEELNRKAYPEKFGKRCNALDVVCAVFQIIDEQPTAFDVDKIEKRLREVSVPENKILYLDPDKWEYMCIWKMP